MIDRLANIINIGSRVGKVSSIAILILCFLSPSLAQDKKVNISELVQETQKFAHSHEFMAVVWWVPEDFWRVNFEQNPKTTQAQYEELIRVVKPYAVFPAIDGKIGNFVHGMALNYNEKSQYCCSRSM